MVNKLLARCDKGLAILARYSAYLSAIVIFAMMLVMVACIIFRRVGVDIYFVEEYAGYALVFITYLGLAYTQRTDGHVRVDLIFGRLNPKVQDVLNLIINVICLFTLFVLLDKSIGTVAFSIKAKMRSDFISHSPLWPFHLLVPLGLGLLSLEMLLGLFSQLIKVLARVTPGKASKKAAAQTMQGEPSGN